MADEVLARWRGTLERLLAVHDRIRSETPRFQVKLFLVFFLINIVCYWWAMITAFPELVLGASWRHYFRMQIPLGLLATVFEMISFHLTVFLVRRAVKAKSSARFLVHVTMDVTVDVLIGTVGTLWVVVSLSLSSWLVTLSEEGTRSTASVPPISLRSTPTLSEAPEGPLARRQIGDHALEIKRDYYVYMIQQALLHPLRNWRSLYFGTVMSFTELLPTLLHLWLGLAALVLYLRGREPAA